MFEPELRMMSVVKRWGIVRTIERQSNADHSFYVATYANDICSILGLDNDVRCVSLMRALWHDMDEIFSNDMVGPYKRHLLDVEKSKNWLSNAMTTVFGAIDHRRGWTRRDDKKGQIADVVVKIADYLDAGIFLLDERSVGNKHVEPHIDRQFAGAVKTARDLKDLGVNPDKVESLITYIRETPNKHHSYPINSRLTY